MNIKELRRLERAATPGPWETTTWDGLLYVASVQQLQGSYVCELGIGSDGAERDAALIAAARNALPALLRVAEAARNATSLNSLCAELMVKLHGADPTIEDESALNSLYEEEEAAWVELHAALAALETQS